jgi:hypothetical protein
LPRWLPSLGFADINHVFYFISPQRSKFVFAVSMFVPILGKCE